MNVITTISIGDRRSLTVVRFGERTLLVGSTPQSFTLLASDDCESLLPFSFEESSPRSVADVLSASEGREINPSPSFAAELEHLEAWKNTELFRAVAEILAYVYKQRQAHRK